VLLVAVAVAGEPISLAASATQVAGGIGGGLDGASASTRLNDDDEIGDYLLDGDDVDDLLEEGDDAPSEEQLGIPGTMLDAYMQAADRLAVLQPNCHLDWPLLASIGRIESNHARGGRVNDNGDTISPILGPVLNGGGFAAIRDTDNGSWDGDSSWDRAVGSMQFIPGTWKGYAADGNDDGVSSPHNVYDATLAAGKYLCSGGLDLANPTDRAAAVFRYNHSNSYVQTVLSWADAYANGFTPMPDYDVPADDYDYDDDYYGQGPSSNGSTPPIQTPTTNVPVPPPGTPPTAGDKTTPTTMPTPPTTCSTPPETTTSTTTETTTTTTESVPPESTTSTETTPTTTETTPPATTPPPC
jgi:hypothetical protein